MSGSEPTGERLPGIPVVVEDGKHLPPEPGTLLGAVPSNRINRRYLKKRLKILQKLKPGMIFVLCDEGPGGAVGCLYVGPRLRVGLPYRRKQ